MDADATTVRIRRADAPELDDLFDGAPPVSYVMILTGRNDEAVIGGSHIEIAAIVRRLAVEARHRFAGSGVSTLPDYALPVQAVAAELLHSGYVPDEDGALLAAGQVVDFLRSTGFDVISRPQEPPAPKEPLPVLGPGASIVPELLKPGRQVLREVEQSRGGWWGALTPCCERWARLARPPHDDEEPSEEGVAVFCNACTILYRVRWQRQIDERWGPSWLAEFEVVHTQVATATRNYRKATR